MNANRNKKKCFCMLPRRGRWSLASTEAKVARGDLLVSLSADLTAKCSSGY